MMLTNEHKPTCVILAAGSSSRMGTPKPFLRFDDQFTFLEQIVHTYFVFGVHRIFIVVNRNFKVDAEMVRFSLPANSKIIVNRYPERGRLYSLQLGLKANGNRSPAFVQNVDNPCISSGILSSLFTGLKDNEVTVPEFAGRKGHPVLLGKNAITAISENPDFRMNLRDFLQQFKTAVIPVNDDGILININTLKEYRNYFPR